MAINPFEPKSTTLVRKVPFKALGAVLLKEAQADATFRLGLIESLKSRLFHELLDSNENIWTIETEWDIERQLLNVCVGLNVLAIVGGGDSDGS